ncbi:MAG: GNA1162 family protein [Planctomycetota bacterium]
MKRFALLIFLVTIAGCETAARVSVNPRFKTFEIRRVAILPFEGVPVEKEVEEYHLWWRHNIVDNGAALSDIFTTEMMSIPNFDYVERSQIQRILQEQNITLTDLVRDKSASEIGKLLGADAVVLGKVHKFAYGFNVVNMKTSHVSFSVRMVDAKTGTVLWSASVEREAGGAEIMTLAREECAKVVAELKAKVGEGAGENQK